MTHAWDAHYAGGGGRRFWPAEELVRSVREHRVKFDRALEVGCGVGANLWFLADEASLTGGSVVGVDIHLPVLKDARAYCGHRTRGYSSAVMFAGADARRLPFPDGTFDVVVDCLTSQHLPWAMHGAVYAEYRRVLRPGGLLWLMHLTRGTESVRGRTLGAFDWDGLALFPSVEFFCLPGGQLLQSLVDWAGFTGVTLRRQRRIYEDGQVADYAIVEGRAR